MKILAALAAVLLATSAQAHSIDMFGTLGPEVTGATGTGSLHLQYDEDGHTLLIDADWSGLSGTTTIAHIHCCTASPNTGTAGIALGTGSPINLPDWPAGVTSGSYDRVIDLTDAGMYSATFVTASGGTAAGAEARLISNLLSGNAYFNIHTSTFGGGEIRAFVVAEPATGALFLPGLVALAWVRRLRRA